ncbi:MarR family winged helix-turn-helix transcriptional regulator [Serpentinicella alkaliphila]|uniref:MarR family transcriptional regulator for hemolysin n=1 Tax=Serpentinicella alkaliphila TaxID=1734049 RepID=A0A4R2T7B5_9FIRM|nr:MarR family transcriptional regulator [Serpentinicella alkaliphila]QUH26555.1 MarR family transcriptional regulator [Serpentinicella alkaliphila]TCP99039.1 MarR family transcriptional regulator for hemolysin [Serpentinicella alkaliphila]
MKNHSDSLGFLLNNAARLTKLDFSNRMDKLGITFPQFLVIKDIYNFQGKKEEGLTLAAIAERLNSNRPNMTGIIDRLEKQGLVSRTINNRDRRSQIITLTEKSYKLMEELHKMSNETTNKALIGFNEEEQKRVKEYLFKIINNLYRE